MKKISRLLFCCSLLLIITNSSFSQKTTTKTTKTTTKNKDVPPPPPKKEPPVVKTQKADTTELPPDVQDLQDTKIDADSPVFGKLDTIPPPQDELTTELRKMLET